MRGGARAHGGGQFSALAARLGHGLKEECSIGPQVERSGRGGPTSGGNSAALAQVAGAAWWRRGARLPHVSEEAALSAAVAQHGVAPQRGEPAEACTHLLRRPGGVGQQRRCLLQVGDQHAPRGGAVSASAA